MAVVRKEVETVGDNELIVEIIEDGPTSNRVALTLMSKGSQGEVALGRANLGQIFRKQLRAQAEALVDALLGFLHRAEEAPVPIEAQIKERVLRGNVPGLPKPVKSRGADGSVGAGIELDHHSRQDFASTLRKIADSIETNDPCLTIHRCDIELFRGDGGGQTVSLQVTKGK